MVSASYEGSAPTEPHHQLFADFPRPHWRISPRFFRGNFYYPHEQRGCAMSLHTHRTESRAADPYRFAEPRIRIHKTEEGKQERCRESTYLRDNSVRIAEIKMLLFTIINALLLLLLTMLPLFKWTWVI